MRQVAHVLLTRPPLNPFPKELHSLDLHVLGTPPAFVLSQDQTLMFNPSPPSQVFHQELAKAPSFLPAQEAFHSSNLTSRFFFISVSFSRIARCRSRFGSLRTPRSLTA